MEFGSFFVLRTNIARTSNCFVHPGTYRCPMKFHHPGQPPLSRKKCLRKKGSSEQQAMCPTRQTHNNRNGHRCDLLSRFLGSQNKTLPLIQDTRPGAHQLHHHTLIQCLILSKVFHSIVGTSGAQAYHAWDPYWREHIRRISSGECLLGIPRLSMTGR